MYLDDSLKSAFSNSTPLFDQIMALQGDCFRALEGRSTIRVKLNGHDYFIKQHRGVGYREIIKNLLQGKLPVVSARNEWQALQKLRTLGVAVPRVVGYGERGLNPATRESFVIMEALAPVISLEELGANFKQVAIDVPFKRQLIAEVARMTRVMHEHGMNHRDLYICHFLLDQKKLKQSDALTLYLIDLHRAQMRSKVPTRWLIKDLAALYFSSRDVGLTKNDLFRFMKHYRNLPLHVILRDENEFWQKVKNRGDDLYRDHAN